MKKIFRSFLIAMLMTVLIASTAMAGYSVTYKIIAAQHDHVGNLYVTGRSTDGTLKLYFDMKGDYCITDAAAHVALAMEDIPQNKGGAIPGQFDYKYDFGGCVTEASRTITVPADMVGHELILAVHTNVSSLLGGYEETGWTVTCGNLAATQFPGKNWSAWFRFPADAWINTPCGCN